MGEDAHGAVPERHVHAFRDTIELGCIWGRQAPMFVTIALFMGDVVAERKRQMYDHARLCKIQTLLLLTLGLAQLSNYLNDSVGLRSPYPV